MTKHIKLIAVAMMLAVVLAIIKNYFGADDAILVGGLLNCWDDSCIIKKMVCTFKKGGER